MEETQSELTGDERIAHIVAFIANDILEGTEYSLDSITSIIYSLISITSSTCRVNQYLIWVIEQHRRHLLNLEGRVFDLEGKLAKRGTKYEYY